MKKYIPPKTRTKQGKTFARLDIHIAGFFDDPYEWSIIDFVYFRSQKDGKWKCRLGPIKDNTPIKKDQTILAALNRLAEKGLMYKQIYGKPQQCRVGKGKSIIIEKQRYQYTFYKKTFDKWLENVLLNRRRMSSEMGGPVLRNGRRLSSEIGGYKDRDKDSDKDSVQGASAIDEFDKVFGNTK